MTLASGQRPQGVKSSKTQKRSSTFKFGQPLVHFERFCWFGIYSLRNLFQKCSAKCCEVLQNFQVVIFLSEKTAGRKLTVGLPKIKWFGVRGSESLMSLEVYVRGREFMYYFIFQVNVDNVSCVSVLDPMTVYKDNLNTCIDLSQLPPKCGARGGLNFNLISISGRWSFEANSFDAECFDTFL